MKANIETKENSLDEAINEKALDTARVSLNYETVQMRFKTWWWWWRQGRYWTCWYYFKNESKVEISDTAEETNDDKELLEVETDKVEDCPE